MRDILSCILFIIVIAKTSKNYLILIVATATKICKYFTDGCTFLLGAHPPI